MQNNQQQPRVIETASATTSPDNVNSGPFAYILTGIVLVIVLVVSLAGAGCTAFALTTIADEVEYGDYSSYPYDFDDYYDDDFEDFDEMFQQYYDDLGIEPHGQGADADTATVEDVLDFSLAPFGYTIDDAISASAYSGVPSDVRDFVRAVVKVDNSYTKEITTQLNNAALNEDERTQSIQEAASLCVQAKEALQAVEIPANADGNGSDVRDLLGTAREAACKRWDCIAAEIELLDTDGEIDTSELWVLDQEVYDATDEAADLFLDALDEASA